VVPWTQKCDQEVGPTALHEDYPYTDMMNVTK